MRSIFQKQDLSQSQQGFSLIELLIVVAIILIIAGIAISKLSQSRIAANEASAVNSVRQIKTAEVAYSTAYPTVGYSATLKNLGGAMPCSPDPNAACLLDNGLANSSATLGTGGYIFQATGIGTTLLSDYVIGAVPVGVARTGNHDYCASSDGVIKQQPSTGSTPVTTVTACQSFPSSI